jgi:hypothetical protein
MVTTRELSLGMTMRCRRCIIQTTDAADCFMSEPSVFISHTTQDPRDYARAHEIAAELRELGAEVWIAPDSIPAGTDWEEQIVRGRKAPYES